MQIQIQKQRIPTNEVSTHIGEIITVTGWLHSWREMGGVSFLVLRDAWGTIQLSRKQRTSYLPYALWKQA